MGIGVQEEHTPAIQRQDEVTPHGTVLHVGTLLRPDTFHGKETAAEERPGCQDIQELGLDLAGTQARHLRPGGLHQAHPLGGTDLTNAQRRLGQQELDLLHGRDVAQVGGAMEEGGYPGHVAHHLRHGHSVARQLQQQTLQIVGSHLIEEHLHVERQRSGLSLQREMPHGSAEDQVEGLAGFQQLRGHIQNILVRSQGHGEGIALDDAVQRELLLLGLGLHAQEGAQLRNDVGHHGGAASVHHALRSSRQPVDLATGRPSSRHGSHLLHTGHVLPTAAACRLPEIREANGGGAMAGTPPVRGRRGQVFHQVGTQCIRAAKVGGQNAEESPGALRTVRAGRSIGRSLFHQLAVDLVTEGQIFVTVLEG